MKVATQTAVALVSISAWIGIAQGQNALNPQASELDVVLENAQTYVAEYEESLGMVIGEEEYVQNATWMVGRFPRRVGSTERRRLKSDFLLLPILDEWYGVRNVLSVDGIAVPAPETFSETPEEIIANRTDAEHNIGDFARTFNVPTFALTLLRPDNIGRFLFEKDDEDRINDVDTWEIDFTEVVSPTMVRGSDGTDRFAKGTFWISPQTGEVLRTELVFEVESTQISFEARIRVEYEANVLLDLFVPDKMEEHYTSDVHTVDARADYSNFKRFSVRIDLNPGVIVQ
jgi:hypothetical protein